MLLNNTNEVIRKLISIPVYTSFIKKEVYYIPRPYYKNIKDVRAIILGADPSNPQDKTFEYVFGLERGDKSPYFQKILGNISNINLNLDNIYVQNLCKNYFTEVTDDNDLYNEIAEKYWLPQLKYELDSLFAPNIPVLVTAWKVLEVIAPAAEKYAKAKNKIYNNSVVFLDNRLSRPVFALFRGGNNYYNLAKSEFANYSALLKNYIK